jgi:hypothetical protein
MDARDVVEEQGPLSLLKQLQFSAVQQSRLRMQQCSAAEKVEDAAVQCS